MERIVEAVERAELRSVAVNSCSYQTGNASAQPAGTTSTSCLAPGAGARLKSTKRGWNATNECCCTVPTPGSVWKHERSPILMLVKQAGADHACWSFAFAISLHAARLGGHYGHAEVACLSIRSGPLPCHWHHKELCRNMRKGEENSNKEALSASPEWLVACVPSVALPVALKCIIASS